MEVSTVSAIQLIKAIVNASEKAACIARCCRSEDKLFSLLVEEKKDEQKNKRFVQDFKTLADVLVQATIKHNLQQKFPGISSFIHGEESNHFTNVLGESIDVEVCKTEAETVDLLTKVLDGNSHAASLLGSTVHKDIDLDINTYSVPLDFFLSLDDCGIWIDPIDSTSEYIHGKMEEPLPEGLVLSGLQCVCVLIGIYSLNSGNPILGVVNQPFHFWNADENKWKGQWYWGISHDTCNISSFVMKLPDNFSQKIVVVSSSESSNLVEILNKKYKVIFSAGAGYKILSVALGLADLYFLSKNSTFRWDSCGPHALLLSVGGGVVIYNTAMKTVSIVNQMNLRSLQVCYNTIEKDATGVDQWCNVNGIIAYRNPQILAEAIAFLQENGF